jgi:hypothetical protein
MEITDGLGFFEVKALTWNCKSQKANSKFQRDAACRRVLRRKKIDWLEGKRFPQNKKEWLNVKGFMRRNIVPQIFCCSSLEMSCASDFQKNS